MVYEPPPCQSGSTKINAICGLIDHYMWLNQCYICGLTKLNSSFRLRVKVLYTTGFDKMDSDTIHRPQHF